VSPRRKRTRTRGGPKCRHCDARVVWFTDVVSGKARKFDPKPVDGRAHTGRPACPVENGRHAWRFRDLVEDLMVRRECSQETAQAEAYDMPWYVQHHCPEDPYTTNEESERPWTG
jgi:hypothetical protein